MMRMLTLIMLRKQIEEMPPIMRKYRCNNREICRIVTCQLEFRWNSNNDEPLVMHLIGESRLAIEGKMNISILADLYMIAIVKKMKTNMKVDLTLSK